MSKHTNLSSVSILSLSLLVSGFHLRVRSAIHFVLVGSFLVAALSSILLAAPHNGEAYTYSQPDGEEFKVRLWGDEFFAYAETLDGYLITRDPESNEFCFARVSEDGTEMISTGVRIGKPRPKDLKLKQRLSNEEHKKRVQLRQQSQDIIRKRHLQPHRASLDSAESQESNGVLTKTGLTLLAYFPDRPGDINKSREEMDDYFNASNYSADGNATSVFGYFYVQSNGKLHYKNIVTAWFETENNRDYYTANIGNSSRVHELVREGLVALEADGFDFSQCDADNDGNIDAVNLMYAGARVNSWGEGLWPQQTGTYWTGFKDHDLNENFAYQLSDTPSDLGIGTTCHENGHMILGLPDLYPYNGSAAHPGDYSLMGFFGSETHPASIDAYLKIQSGLASVVDLDSSSHQRCVVQAGQNHFYRYRNPNRPDEAFVFELRYPSGYEGPTGGSTRSVNPSSGLVVYHTLDSGSNSYSSIFTSHGINADYSTPFRFMVVEARPYSSLSPWYLAPWPTGNDAYKGNDINVISDSTSPALRFWDSNGRTIASQAHVHSISEVGETMSFVIGTGLPSSNSSMGLTVSSVVKSIASGTDAPSKQFALFNKGAGSFSYEITSDSSWVSVNAPSGAVSEDEIDLVSINFSTASLSPGIYSAKLTISSPTPSVSSREINISLKVEGESLPQFSFFEGFENGIDLWTSETVNGTTRATGLDPAAQSPIGSGTNGAFIRDNDPTSVTPQFHVDFATDGQVQSDQSLYVQFDYRSLGATDRAEFILADSNFERHFGIMIDSDSGNLLLREGDSWINYNLGLLQDTWYRFTLSLSPENAGINRAMSIRVQSIQSASIDLELVDKKAWNDATSVQYHKANFLFGGGSNAPVNGQYYFDNLRITTDPSELDYSRSINHPPVFSNNPLQKSHAIELVSYLDTISGDVSDQDGDLLTFSKLGGPAWLSVDSDGKIHGNPTSSDIGDNTFTVSVSDGVNPAVEVQLSILVRSAYEHWAGTTDFNADGNGDGIKDGLAWLLAASDPTENANEHLPQLSINEAGDIVVQFNYLNQTNRGSFTLFLQYSRDLGKSDLWQNHSIQIPDLSSTVSGVSFQLFQQGTFNSVQAVIPGSAVSEDGSFFVRLCAENTP